MLFERHVRTLQNISSTGTFAVVLFNFRCLRVDPEYCQPLFGLNAFTHQNFWLTVFLLLTNRDVAVQQAKQKCNLRIFFSVVVFQSKTECV